MQSGSGFVVSGVGQVLTNFHVIEGCTTVRAHHQGQVRAAEIGATNEGDDLALLGLAGVRAADVARFRSGDGIRSGDDVVGLAFPLRGLLANQANVTVGIVSAIIVAKLDTLQVAELTGDIPQNVNFAIKAAVARTFLTANAIRYQTTPLSEHLDTADIADLGRTVTVAVECVQ